MSYRWPAGLVLGSLSLLAAVPGGLSIKVSREVAPPGGVAQMKVYITDPKPIIRGFVDMEMDSRYMEDVLGVAINSPLGDACGTARLEKGRLKFEFSSPLASLGTNLDYPVLTIALRVRKDAPRGQVFPINLDLTNSAWIDPYGQPYPAESRAGELLVEGTLSVDNIVPGGGLVPAGTPVRIVGQGFGGKTNVRVDTDAKYTTTYINPGELQLRFNSAVDLRATRMVVKNGPENTTYYSYLRAAEAAPLGTGPLVTSKPLFPGTTMRSGVVLHAANGMAAQGLALENPGSTPAAVTLERKSLTGLPLGGLTLTLAPATRLSLDFAAAGLGGVEGSVTRVTSAAGLEVMGLALEASSNRVLPIMPLVAVPAQ